MNKLIDYFKNVIAISPEIESKMNAIIKERNLVKGEKILMDNSLKKEHIFVVTGCLRSFYKTENGKEK